MCGKDDSSDEMLAMQKQEAKEARVKDEERRARIAKGVQEVQNIYKGRETMQDTPMSFQVTAAPNVSGFGQAAAAKAGIATQQVKDADKGLPAGFTRGTRKVAGPGGAAQPAMKKVWTDEQGRPSAYARYVPDTSAPGRQSVSTMQRGVYDAQGNFYPEGGTANYTGQTGTGQFTGGFDDAFYDKYRSAMTGYYMPQVWDKYKDAQDETTYALARAGTLTSSMAIDKVADLLKQKEDQEAKVANAADTAVGEKKTQIGQEMANAINMVNSVEDPEVAVSTALDRAENITAEPADLSPLGDIFKVALIGASKFAEGRQAKKVRDALGTQQGGYLVNTTA